MYDGYGTDVTRFGLWSNYSTARPNGNGNNFGITLYRNGNSNTPTASCSAA
ncbi:hypothetical protein [Micromonospora sp. CNB394]|uniref:hypothetical protein n=1 Tax=Micromonospora sp. CNB394 TaxID=1169151 RepID=UPI0003644B5C|nr:hypothetical protein [Micromonospora sp. CNB394]